MENVFLISIYLHFAQYLGCIILFFHCYVFNASRYIIRPFSTYKRKSLKLVFYSALEAYTVQTSARVRWRRRERQHCNLCHCFYLMAEWEDFKNVERNTHGVSF